MIAGRQDALVALRDLVEAFKQDFFIILYVKNSKKKRGWNLK